jgi:hypothetical protein
MRRAMGVKRCLPGKAAGTAGLCAGAVAVFLLLPSAASSTALGPAFPPGQWCGVGKVPVGKQITIKARRLTFVNGRMNFNLSSEQGDAKGAADANLRFHYEDKASKEDFEGEFRYIGDFDISGSAREPKLAGTWTVKGVFVAIINGQQRSFPVNTTEKAKSWLDVDWASLDLVRGNWASTASWKWKATRLKSTKAGLKC